MATVRQIRRAFNRQAPLALVRSTTNPAKGRYSKTSSATIILDAVTAASRINDALKKGRTPSLSSLKTVSHATRITTLRHGTKSGRRDSHFLLGGKHPNVASVRKAAAKKAAARRAAAKRRGGKGVSNPGGVRTIRDSKGHYAGSR